MENLTWDALAHKTIIELFEELEERNVLAEHRKKKASAWCNEILRRGNIRAKHDPIYAAIRDAIRDAIVRDLSISDALKFDSLRYNAHNFAGRLRDLMHVAEEFGIAYTEGEYARAAQMDATGNYMDGTALWHVAAPSENEAPKSKPSRKRKSK